MTEQISEDQIKKNLIVEIANTSIFIFWQPTVVALCSVAYMLSNKSSNILISLVVFVPFFIISFLNYFYKSIYLTKSSIYFFKNGISIFKVKLNDDFYIFDVKQSFFGKILNYGDIVVVNRDNKYITYSYINNPLKFKIKLIQRYEEEMKKIDPNYILPKEYSDQIFKETDKIDRL